MSRYLKERRNLQYLYCGTLRVAQNKSKVNPLFHLPISFSSKCYNLAYIFVSVGFLKETMALYSRVRPSLFKVSHPVSHLIGGSVCYPVGRALCPQQGSEDPMSRF